MNAYQQQNPTVKLSPRLAVEMPQFLLLKHYQTGVLTGRLYVPSAWARLKSFQSWLSTVQVIWVKNLGNGNLTLWIATNHAEYERLLKTYPHTNQFNRGKSWEYLRADNQLNKPVVVEPVTPVIPVPQFTGYAEPVVEIEEPEDLTLGVDEEVKPQIINAEIKAVVWQPKTRGELRSMTKTQLYNYAKTLVNPDSYSLYITKRNRKAEIVNKIESWLAHNS